MDMVDDGGIGVPANEQLNSASSTVPAASEQATGAERKNWVEILTNGLRQTLFAHAAYLKAFESNANSE